VSHAFKGVLSVGGGAAAKYTAHLHTARTHSAILILLVAENVIIYPPARGSIIISPLCGARPILNPPSKENEQIPSQSAIDDWCAER
jgi:hypothetical protein